MANSSLFPNTTSGGRNKGAKVNTVNNAGGIAYSFTPFHELCQFVATGVFRGTYYTTASEQLARFLELTDSQTGHIDDEKLAKLAIWGRHHAFMKDTPTAVMMILLKRNNMPLFHKVFDKVMDNGRMIRNAFQMLRSGTFGRKSMSYSIQRAFSRWFNTAPIGTIIAGSVGNDPSLKDVLRMARPKPADNERDAVFAWIAGKNQAKHSKYFPVMLQEIINFRNAASDDEQAKALSRGGKIRWEMLADSAKGTKAWTAIARSMGHQALRMNLNTLSRHNVFNSSQMVAYVAGRLSDATEIERARQWPVQYFTAYKNGEDIPYSIRNALHTAAEISCGNIPEIDGPLLVGVDTSGSMGCPVTGNAGGNGHTSKTLCREAAAVFAAAILKKNPDSLLVPFDHTVHMRNIDAGDTILSISSALSKLGGGGTNCSLPLAYANNTVPHKKFAGCVMISDNESWIYNTSGWRAGHKTEVVKEWEKFKSNQKKLGVQNPKLLNIDLAPNSSTQAPNASDIMNVGGFSDAVFNIISGWMFDKSGTFTEQIEGIEI